MYVNSSDVSTLVDCVRQLAPGPGDVVTLFVGEHDPPPIEELVRALDAEGVSFFGGIFPGVIHGERRYDRGVVMARLPRLSEPILVRDLSSRPELGGLPPREARAGRRSTAMVLVDGLTTNIAGFLQDLFNRYGSSVHYVGGGAGSLTLEPARCLFTAEGFVQDAAIVCLLDLDSSLGVRHGWQRLSGPVVATETRANRLRALNWRPALDVYVEAVEADCGRRPTPEAFFDLAKNYPFGMRKEGGEEIVRDPIAASEDGEIVCVGEVPENTVLTILKGDAQQLIEAAAQAARDSRALAGGEARGCLIVDCISRVIFLEDRFADELGAVAATIGEVLGDAAPVGVLSLGEISSYGQGFLEFFNKTIVVALLYE